MNKTKNFQINVGSSSILLIFLVVCLVSFSVLSIVSANADKRLSDKVLNRTTAYYQACNSAEESLASIDKTLAELYASAPTQDEYYSAAGGRKLTYVYTISDIQTLNIELEVLYPDSSDGPFYQVTSWEILTTGTLDYDDTLNLFIP